MSAGCIAVKAQYAVARDGRFLINESAEGPAAVPITLVLNWAGEREPARADGGD